MKENRCRGEENGEENGDLRGELLNIESELKRNSEQRAITMD